MGGWGDDSWENDTEWDDAGGIERYRHHIQHHHHHPRIKHPTVVVISSTT